MFPPHHGPWDTPGFGTRHWGSSRTTRAPWGPPARQLLLPGAGAAVFPGSRPGPGGPWLGAEPGAGPPPRRVPSRGSAKLTHRQEGPPSPWPALTASSCSPDPLPEPKGPKAEAGAGSHWIPSHGIPTRSRGDGSAPGVSGIDIGDVPAAPNPGQSRFGSAGTGALPHMQRGAWQRPGSSLGHAHPEPLRFDAGFGLPLIWRRGRARGGGLELG